MYIYIDMCIHMHIHMHIHMYIHIHIIPYKLCTQMTGSEVRSNLDQPSWIGAQLCFHGVGENHYEVWALGPHWMCPIAG